MPKRACPWRLNSICPMYPLRDSTLTLANLAYEWGRELAQRPSEVAVMNHLLSAIWAGELIARKPTTGEPTTPDDLLGMVVLTKAHPGIEIRDTGETRSSSSIELPDGGIDIDLRAVIALPEDPERWTIEQKHAAIGVLSHRPLSDFTAAFRVAISLVDVTRDDFANYCASAGYPLPAFWFGKQTLRTSLAKAERDCAEWLRSLAKEPKQHPKAWYRDEAIRRFPGLSAKGFDRAWKRATPKEWWMAGAPGKRKRRDSIRSALKSP
jgi:hypothetical protein